jgi:hypothetical protein
LFPIVLAFLTGGCLVVVGACLRAGEASEWLDFAGAIIGSALAASTAYWVIVVQERRAVDAKRKVARDAIDAVEATLTRFLLVAKEQDLFLEDEDMGLLLKAETLLEAAATNLLLADLQASLIVSTLQLKLKNDWATFLRTSPVVNQIVATGARLPLLSEEAAMFEELLMACLDAKAALRY